MERRKFLESCVAMSGTLGLSVPAATALRREDGATYAWGGGVGPARAIVAFSAICAHKLAYPTREVSFIRYQPQRSATSDAQVIHCCADHSVYDPAAGRRERRRARARAVLQADDPVLTGRARCRVARRLEVRAASRSVPRGIS